MFLSVSLVIYLDILHECQVFTTSVPVYSLWLVEFPQYLRQWVPSRVVPAGRDPSGGPWNASQSSPHWQPLCPSTDWRIVALKQRTGMKNQCVRKWKTHMDIPRETHYISGHWNMGNTKVNPQVWWCPICSFINPYLDIEHPWAFCSRNNGFMIYIYVSLPQGTTLTFWHELGNGMPSYRLILRYGKLKRRTCEQKNDVTWCNPIKWGCWPKHMDFTSVNIWVRVKIQGMDQGPEPTHDPYPPIHTLIHTLRYCMIHTLDPYPWSIPLIHTPFSLKKDWCWP